MLLGRWDSLATLRRAVILAVLASLAVLLASGCFGATVSAKQLYETNCADCHGEKGNRLPIAPLDSKEYLTKVGDAGLFAATKDGKGAMPAWGKEKGGTLDDEQITAVLQYLKTGEDKAVKPAPVRPAASQANGSEALDELLHNPAVLMVLFVVGLLGFLAAMNRLTSHG